MEVQENKDFTITIRNAVYKIIEVDENDYRLATDDDNELCYGIQINLKQEIVIRNDLKPNRKFQTLVHELTHAIIDEYGFNGRDFDQEQLCIFMETYANDIIAIANDYMMKNL